MDPRGNSYQLKTAFCELVMTDQFFYATPGAKRAAGNSDRGRDDSGPKGKGPKRAAGRGGGAEAGSWQEEAANS